MINPIVPPKMETHLWDRMGSIINHSQMVGLWHWVSPITHLKATLRSKGWGNSQRGSGGGGMETVSLEEAEERRQNLGPQCLEIWFSLVVGWSKMAKVN